MSRLVTFYDILRYQNCTAPLGRASACLNLEQAPLRKRHDKSDATTGHKTQLTKSERTRWNFLLAGLVVGTSGLLDCPGGVQLLQLLQPLWDSLPTLRFGSEVKELQLRGTAGGRLNCFSLTLHQPQFFIWMFPLHASHAAF